MILELSKTDMLCLVKGTTPKYEDMDNELIKQCGNYTGGMHDKWDWNTSILNELTEETLLKIFLICRPRKVY